MEARSTCVRWKLRSLKKRPSLQKRPKALVRWKRPCAPEQMPVYDGKGFALSFSVILFEPSLIEVRAGSTVYRQCTFTPSNIFFFFSHIPKACGTRWYLSTARMASVPSNGEDPATPPSRAAGRRRGSGAWRRAQCRRDPVAGSAHHGTPALGGREPRKIRGDGAGEARVRVVRRAAWHLALEVRRRRAARRAAASANLLRPSAHLACVFPNEEWDLKNPPTRGQRAPGSARTIAHTRDRERSEHVSGFARATATWLQHMPLESCGAMCCSAGCAWGEERGHKPSSQCGTPPGRAVSWSVGSCVLSASN